VALSSGTRLGAYEIIVAIGSGGMGEVYRATDPRLGRDVAIKVLPASLSNDPDRLRRFEQEARAAAALNHPNVLAVYDVGTHEASPYIVSELLTGATVRDRLNAGPLPVHKAIDTAVQVTRGLAAAHEKGIVHRDLKPENVFVTESGLVKILDFGLAKLTRPDPALSAESVVTREPDTRPGIVMGTVGYMSPEQVRGLQADHRTDIFAFGALLYELLAGRRAFDGNTNADVMTAILKEDAPDLRAAQRQIPPALVRIVDRCLEKSPAARFQSAGDLGFALEGLTGHTGAVDAVPGPAPHSRARLAWTVAGVLAVALAGALAWGAVASFKRPPVETATAFSLNMPAGWTLMLTDGVTSSAPLAVSPDERQIAFVAQSGDGKSAIWLRTRDILAPRMLPGTEGASSPFWSPDGRHLAFFIGPQLKRVDISTGLSTVICEVTYPAIGGTWNAAGTILFAEGGPAASRAAGLWKVQAAGGPPVSATQRGDKETNHVNPLFLPDGRHFLFRALTGPVVRGPIYLASVDGKNATRLLDVDSSNVVYSKGHLLFLRGSTLVAQSFDESRLTLSGEPFAVAESIQAVGAVPSGVFSASPTGLLAYQTGSLSLGSSLVWFDRTGKRLGTMGHAGAYADVQLSPDGTQAAVSSPDALSGRSPRPSAESAAATADRTFDIWFFDVASGLPRRLTFDAADDLAALWSPNGKEVVFNSRRRGYLDLYRKAADGSGAETELLVDQTDKTPISWSPDGTALLYLVGAMPARGRRGGVGGKMAIWVLPMTEGGKPFTFIANLSSAHLARFSPDGRWVAYGFTENRREEVYVVPFPQGDRGGRWQISSEGGFAPRWSLDGKEIYYISPGPDPRLMARAFSSVGITFRPLGITPLFSFRPGGPRSTYDVTRDGRFLVNTVDAPDKASPMGPPTIVTDWLAVVAKR